MFIRGSSHAFVVPFFALKSSPRRLPCLVLQRLTKAVMVLALAGSIGLHWELFQSVAWLRMVLNYSQDATLSEALAKTFDGKHPCSLCKEIAKGKQSEKASDMPPGWNKFEFSYTATKFLFNAPTQCWKVPMTEVRGNLLADAPPVPPPKSSLA